MSQPNPEFVRGFARLVIDKGFGAIAPTTQKDKHGRPLQETWQDVGRRLYGRELFNTVLKEEIAARKVVPLQAASAP